MDCTGIADASTEFEFKIVEFSPMVTAYLFEAGRDYYYIGKFAHFQFSHMISQNLKFSSLKCTKIIYRLNSEKFQNFYFKSKLSFLMKNHKKYV